jgi:hypothetical protein
MCTRFFEKIVALCVDANAAIHNMIDRTESEANQHHEELWVDDEQGAAPETLQDLVEKYNGERLTGLHKPSYKRVTDEKVSLTDPDAAPMRAQGGGSAGLGYQDHYVVDGGKARILLSALVSPNL